MLINILKKFIMIIRKKYGDLLMALRRNWPLFMIYPGNKVLCG